MYLWFEQRTVLSSIEYLIPADSPPYQCIIDCGSGNLQRLHASIPLPNALPSSSASAHANVHHPLSAHPRHRQASKPSQASTKPGPGQCQCLHELEDFWANPSLLLKVGVFCKPTRVLSSRYHV